MKLWRLVSIAIALLLAGCFRIAADSQPAIEKWLDSQPQVTLYVLDPFYLTSPQKKVNDATPQLLGYKVLRTIEVKSASDSMAVTSAIKRAIAKGSTSRSECFEPRCGIKLSDPTGDLDLAVCFKCSNFVSSLDPSPLPIDPGLSLELAPLFKRR